MKVLKWKRQLIHLMDFLELAKSRRSVRKFLNQPISKELLLKIVEYGRWAPSGLNNQPWKIIGILKKELLLELANCTTSSHVLKEAAAALVIYLDKRLQYNYTKDIQGIGALFQNLLLGIHAENIGGCWLGEILNKTEKVNKILNISSNEYELMGVIAIGIPKPSELSQESKRKSIDEIFEFFE